MTYCVLCEKNPASKYLKVCKECILHREEALDYIQKIHKRVRVDFSMPSSVPKEGKECKLCINNCRIPEGGWGFCQVRYNQGGQIKSDVVLEYYYDPLPTNCVAGFICSGRNKFGYKNLAVFYCGCSFNCLFCQNWHYRYKRGIRLLPSALAEKVKEDTYCICYFGGDPSCFLTHAIKTSEIAIKKNIKICFETNGSFNPKLCNVIVKLLLESGGCIKFDLKAYDERLNIALCGVSNKNTLENFKYFSSFFDEKRDMPILVASTLLVPFYIDEEEVFKIARFIADCNPKIPLSLLGFYPHFYMSDLPRTSKRQAYRCYEAAKSAGLEFVNIGNVHLLI